MDSYYYLNANNEQAGPISPEDFKTYGITRDTMVWKLGMANWTKAGEVFELSQYFKAATPPPPPPPPPGGNSSSGSSYGSSRSSSSGSSYGTSGSPYGGGSQSSNTGGSPGNYGGNPYNGRSNFTGSYGTSSYSSSNYGQPLRPNNYLVWAILSTLFCCLPLGLYAIILASKVNGLFDSGLYEEAEEASAKAKKWTITAVVLGLIANVLYILVMVADNL